jgi:hypothetical protein
LYIARKSVLTRASAARASSDIEASVRRASVTRASWSHDNARFSCGRICDGYCALDPDGAVDGWFCAKAGAHISVMVAMPAAMTEYFFIDPPF